MRLYNEYHEKVYKPITEAARELLREALHNSAFREKLLSWCYKLGYGERIERWLEAAHELPLLAPLLQANLVSLLSTAILKAIEKGELDELISLIEKYLPSDRARELVEKLRSAAETYEKIRHAKKRIAVTA